MSWEMYNISNTTAVMEDGNYNDSDYNSDYNCNGSNCSDDFMCEANEQQEHIIKMFQTGAFCLIFLLGIMGNCLVIATFALYRRLQLRSMTDVFLAHLALADLLLLLTLPLEATDTHLGWVFPDFLCRVKRAFYAINTCSGLLLLACISVDRYIVVARAQEMLRLRSHILTAGKVAAVGVWFVAILLSLPEILFSGVSWTGEQAYCGMQKSGHVKMATNVAIICVFCVSFLIMVTCYTRIGLALWEGHVHRKGKQWHRQRTLKLMVVLVVVFLIFQLPYTMVLLRKLAGSFCGLLLEYITCTLAYTRCSLNPILYALVGVRFRKDVLQLIHDSGCPCGFHFSLQTVSSTSISATSPALTVLSACSPTPPDRSTSSSDATAPLKFQFPTLRG